MIIQLNDNCKLTEIPVLRVVRSLYGKLYSKKRTTSLDIDQLVLKSLEGSDIELNSPKPASDFIALVLSSSNLVNIKHTQVKPQVLSLALNHPDVIHRDRLHYPLTQIEEKMYISLIQRIYGGCITQMPFVPSINDAKQFAKAVYRQKELSHIRVGTLINFIIDNWKLISSMAALSLNTLRKIANSIAPKTAFRKGRSNPSDKSLLLNFAQQFTYQG